MTSNPLDDLRQINRDQRNETHIPVDTAERETALTEGRKEGRLQGSKGARAAASTEARQEVRELVSTEAVQDGGVDLREAVRATVTEKRIYQGGVKATIDLSPQLSTRFKRYSIDHSNVTLRQMLTELLETYLTGEGY